MKLAIYTSAYNEYDLPTALRMIAEAGYRHVEVAADISETCHFAAHHMENDATAGLAALLEGHGLQLAALDIGGWDAPLCIANLDEAQRVAAVENVGRAVAVAQELACPLLTFHLWGLPAARARDSVANLRAAFLQSIGDLAPVLDSHDVRLNFMPHPGGFIEESDATVDLVRETGCPYVGYTFGMSHAFVINGPEQTATDMIRYAGETLTHVLVSDTHDVRRIIAPPEVKAHEHTVPGRGDIDFVRVFAALKDIDYDQKLCIHLISERDRIDAAARESRERVEEWLQASPTSGELAR